MSAPSLRPVPPPLSASRTPTGVPARGPAALLALAATAWCTGSCTAPAPVPASFEVELHDGWTVQAAGDATAYPATVPGTVHTDLLAVGAIPDPYSGTNEAELQWIEDEDWVYRLDLSPPPEALAHERLELVFEGLDTYADVTLEGDTLLRADNMFRTWRVALPALGPGRRDLQVRFRSPVREGERLAAAHPFELPQGNDLHDPPTRGFTRKAAYHYGWDWGPRFVTSGIWRPVKLVGWSGVRIRDARVVHDDPGDDEALVTLVLEVEATAGGRGRVQARSLEVAASRGGPAVGAADSRIGGAAPTIPPVTGDRGALFPPAGRTIEVRPGVQTLELPIRIPDPRLWWPRGMGDPHLYQAEVSLAVGRRLAVDTVRFGIRTVRLVTERDSIGESFRFEVNGRPVFARGANVVPLDHFTPRVDAAAYAALFDDVEAANMNMLRVWGGGIYERDLFYDLADERGILIWQDFMFANGLHPGDSSFVASVRAEARNQVRRLRGHPSVALWCGNNEIEEGWANWGWQRAHGWSAADSARIRADYRRVFHEALPDVLAELDPGRPYWPSSPSIGWGHAASLARGDSHYWGVWWGLEPFSVYAEKVPRFASEFGFQGMPDRATIERFGARSAALSDPAMRSHQKHPTGFETLRTYLERDLVAPPDTAIADWIYATQVVQAEGMRVAFEAHRRARPRTMGTLYWQLNDTWPVVSWSSRDHAGRWKLLHHAARRAFAPLLVSPVLKEDSIEVWVADDSLEGADATVAVTLHHVEGDTLGRRETAARTPAAAGARVAAVALEDLAGGAVDRRRSFVTVELATTDGRQVENVLYLAPLGELALPEPGLSARLVPLEGGETAVEIGAELPAHFVHVDFPGAPLEPIDDGFLLLGGEVVRIPVRRLAQSDGEDAAPVVRSLVDLLRRR